MVKNLNTILDILDTSAMDNKGSLIENILSNIRYLGEYCDEICNIIYRCLELLYKIKQAPSLTLSLWIILGILFLFRLFNFLKTCNNINYFFVILISIFR